MSNNTPAPAQEAVQALRDLRLGVEMDRHNLDDGDAKIRALDAAIEVLSKLRAPVADERECGNADCGWRGTTERMCGSVGPLCPECGETTEASAPVAGEATDWPTPAQEAEAAKQWDAWAHEMNQCRDASLEQAARICDAEGQEWDSDAVITEKNYAEHCARRIRALKGSAAPQASEAQCSCPSGDGSLRHPCAVHPPASEAVRDAAFEVVRKLLCAIPRYSFCLDDDGVVRRVGGCSGNWIEFDAAHALFDPVSVDAALSAQPGAQRTGDQ